MPLPMGLKEFLDHHQTAYNTYYPINEFFSWCQHSFAGESIEFLLLARTFHPALGPAPYDFFPSNLTSLTERARYLYLEYARSGAPKQINIPAVPCRQKLDFSYDNDYWDEDSFDEAYKEILQMISTDAWTRFCESDLGRQILVPEGPSFSAVSAAAVHNTFLGSTAYNAAKAARATNFQLPAAPVPHLPPPPAPPRHRRQHAVYTAPQQQAQPVRALPSATFLAAQSPAPPVPSACSSQGANRFPMVVVIAPPAVAERARELQSVLPSVAANTPAVIVSQAKPVPPPLPPFPSLPSNTLAKNKPAPPPLPPPNSPKKSTARFPADVKNMPLPRLPGQRP